MVHQRVGPRRPRKRERKPTSLTFEKHDLPRLSLRVTSSSKKGVGRPCSIRGYRLCQICLAFLPYPYMNTPVLQDGQLLTDQSHPLLPAGSPHTTRLNPLLHLWNKHPSLMQLHKPWWASGCTNMSDAGSPLVCRNRSLQPGIPLKMPTKSQQMSPVLAFVTSDGYGLHRTSEQFCGAASSRYLAPRCWERAVGSVSWNFSSSQLQTDT